MVQDWGMSETVMDPAETKLNPVNASAYPAKRIPFFNKANAKLYAARSAEMRRQAIADREQAHAQAETEAKHGPEQALVKVGADPYVSETLLRTRKQLNKLYKAIDDSELAPAEIDRLASAIARFTEIERNLAMRPGPGTLKPADTVQAKSRAGWLLDSPELSLSQDSKSEQE